MKKLISILFLLMFINIFSKELEVLFFDTTKGVEYVGLERGILEGLKRGKKEYGIKITTVEVDLSQNIKLPLDKIISEKKYDLVLTDSRLYREEFLSYAKDDIFTHFILVGQKAEYLPNLTTITYDMSKTGYMAGVMSAQKSKNKIIGFVGFKAFEFLGDYLSEFSSGAKSVNSEIKILTAYPRDYVLEGEDLYNSLALGNRIGNDLIEKGADVIYQYAGKTGVGVAQAAYESGKGVKVIGTSFYQDYLYDKETVIASLYPDISFYVYSVITLLQNGRAVPYHFHLSLEDGTIINTAFREENKNFTPEEKKYLKNVLNKLILR